MSKSFKVSISTILIAIIVAIAMPAILSYRSDKRQMICKQNLCNISHAKAVVETRLGLKDGGTVQQIELDGVIKDGFSLCPDGGTYTINPVGQDPTCSIGGEHTL